MRVSKRQEHVTKMQLKQQVMEIETKGTQVKDPSDVH